MNQFTQENSNMRKAISRDQPSVPERVGVQAALQGLDANIDNLVAELSNLNARLEPYLLPEKTNESFDKQEAPITSNVMGHIYMIEEKIGNIVLFLRSINHRLEL